ncbi:hypothetical protein ACVOBG_13845, partial [Shigella sonnei]
MKQRDCPVRNSGANGRHSMVKISLSAGRSCDRTKKRPRYFIRTPYNGVLASQTRHDYCPQSSMIRGVMSPGLVGR